MIKKESNTKKIIILIVVFFLGVLLMYGVVYKYPVLITNNVTKLEKNVTITDTGIADAVEKVYDSVVVVATYQDGNMVASGTGFVYKTEKDDAYILTNNHVIESGNEVNVTFTDGKIIKTEIVGTNALSDIAVLKVAKKEIIAVAEIGSSESIRVGDTSFAVGAPLDSVYSWTVTRGIISGKDRMVEVSLSSSAGNYVMKVLQTDAAINSGNSGGPLCNANGEVIGITSLKLVSESVEGMGFAIPIEVALNYADKIIKGEKISQPYLGISMVNVVDAYYYPQYYNIIKENNIAKGVIIVDIEKKSPADKAGLQSKDIIVKINNDEVTSVAYLRYYLYNYNAGDNVEITYIRDGKTLKTTVTLGSNSKTYSKLVIVSFVFYREKI